jgi:hypothetical protein
MTKGDTVRVRNNVLEYETTGQVMDTCGRSVGVQVQVPTVGLGFLHRPDAGDVRHPLTVYFKRDECGSWLSLAGHFRIVGD